LVSLSHIAVFLDIRGVIKKKCMDGRWSDEGEGEKKEKASDYFCQARHGLIITIKRTLEL